jgi:hypothetical protein
VTTVTPQVLLLFKEDQLINLDALVKAPHAGLGEHPFSVVLSSSHRSADGMGGAGTLWCGHNSLVASV